MIFSMMLTVLTVTTDYGFSLVKLNQIQAIEMVDKGDGGILTITLKGDKSEQLVFVEHNKESWDEAKEWMNDSIFAMQEAMSTTDVSRTIDTSSKF